VLLAVDFGNSLAYTTWLHVDSEKGTARAIAASPWANVLVEPVEDSSTTLLQVLYDSLGS